MKLLFDQNISHKVLKHLPEQFSNSTSVKDEGLIHYSDKQIWEFAKINDYIIVTQDSDFNDINLLYGIPPKIIWIRTRNTKTTEIAEILTIKISKIEDFVSDKTYGCLEIYSGK